MVTSTPGSRRPAVPRSARMRACWRPGATSATEWRNDPLGGWVREATIAAASSSGQDPAATSPTGTRSTPGASARRGPSGFQASRPGRGRPVSARTRTAGAGSGTLLAGGASGTVPCPAAAHTTAGRVRPPTAPRAQRATCRPAAPARCAARRPRTSARAHQRRAPGPRRVTARPNGVTAASWPSEQCHRPRRPGTAPILPVSRQAARGPLPRGRRTCDACTACRSWRPCRGLRPS